jgi:hypothetical protein
MGRKRGFIDSVIMQTINDLLVPMYCIMSLGLGSQRFEKYRAVIRSSKYSM